MGSGDASAEEGVRRELALRRAIDHSMRAGVAAVDRDGVQIYVNRAFAEMVGWSVEELIGATRPYRYWPPEEVAAIEEAFARTLGGDAPEGGFGLRFRKKSEERFDVLVHISPLREGDEEPRGWVASVHDITELKRVEHQLRLGESRLRLAIEAGMLGTWEWEIDTGRVVWSRELEHFHGLAPGSFLGTFEAFQSDMHPDDRERVVETIRRTLAEQREDYRNEYRIVLPDGRVRWLEARGRFVPGGPSGPRMVGVCGDVTERKRAEEKQLLLADAATILASSLDIEQTLRGLAGLAVPRLADYCAVHLLRGDGSLVAVELAHVDPEKTELAWEIERRWPASMDAPYGRPLVVRTGTSWLCSRVEPSSIDASAVSGEHREVLRALELRSALVVPLEGRGRVLGTITLSTSADSGRELDSADLALAEELASRAALAIDNARLFEQAERTRVAAERAAARLRILAEASEALASSLDDDTALKTLARFAVRHLADYAVSYALEPDRSIRRVGIAHRDARKQSLVEDLVRAGPPRFDDPFGAGAVIRTGESVLAPDVPLDMLERAAQNEPHLLVLRELAPRSSILVPLVARGRTLGALALAATDASERRYSEDDLVLAVELAGRAALLVDNARLYREAQEALRARDEMVAAVSHDLRSPLQVIRSSTTLLAMPELSADKHARALSAAGRAAQQMERFVKELLDVARIDAGSLVIERGEVDLAALVLETASVLGALAEEKSVHLELVLVDDLPSVRGDASRLRQVLANILANAVEFVPNGGHVRVSAWREAHEVCVAIRDDGPGIPEDQLPFLFDRFWQADRSGRRGTGLGLAIAKGIVDAHGGTLRVVSRVGEGSTFEIALPIVEHAR